MDVLRLKEHRPIGKQARQRGSPLAFDGLEDGVRLGEFPRRQFGINFLPIDAHLKHAAAGRHQRKRADVLLELQKFFRQTDGVRFIVSSRTVFDFDFQAHGGFVSGLR